MNTSGSDQPDTAPFGDRLASVAARFPKANRWFGDLGAIVRAHRDYTEQTFLLFPMRQALRNGLPGRVFGLCPAISRPVCRNSIWTRENQRITRQLILEHISAKENG